MFQGTQHVRAEAELEPGPSSPRSRLRARLREVGGVSLLLPLSHHPPPSGDCSWALAFVAEAEREPRGTINHAKERKVEEGFAEQGEEMRTSWWEGSRD